MLDIYKYAILNPLKSELFTKKACRDVVYSLFFFSNNIYMLYILLFSYNTYFALLLCIEHCFTKIELYNRVSTIKNLMPPDN